MNPCQHPDDIHGLFIVALLKNDVERALSLYADDAAFVIGPEGKKVQGKAAIREQLNKFEIIAPAMELVTKSVIPCGEVAQVVMRWRRSDTGVEYTAVDVLRRNSAGHWQFLIDNPYGQ